MIAVIGRRACQLRAGRVYRAHRIAAALGRFDADISGAETGRSHVAFAELGRRAAAGRFTTAVTLVER